MGRREFVRTLAVSFIALPRLAAAQRQGKLWRIGYLTGGVRPPDGAPPPELRQALAELGYVDGTSISYVGRWAEARRNRFPALAAELVALNVDLIVAAGGPASLAAKEATSTIPIIIFSAGDAVGTGLVASLARPGGNITGVDDQATELSAKRLELLREVVPKASRVAVIWNADDRAMSLRYGEIEKAARALRVTIHPLGVREPDDFEAVFAQMTQERPDALLVVSDFLTFLNRKRILDFAAANRIPAMFEVRSLVQEGGLMSYGAIRRESWRRAAAYIDKILKGAKPAELPVEQPTRYELVVNPKTAKALGVTLPPSLLMGADEVIE